MNKEDLQLEGAQAYSEIQSGGHHVKPSASQLPMVVWLRGDEDLATEFSLDADAAMARLGIKRSRLTQISGRELRVGRRRVDRYIRPFYRPLDIDEYASWTRATASHSRSASFLKEATEALQEQSDRLASSLLGVSTEWADRVIEKTDGLQRQLEVSIIQQLSDLLNQTIETARLELGKLASVVHSLQDQSTHHTERVLDRLNEDLGRIIQSLNDIPCALATLDDIRHHQRCTWEDLTRELDLVHQQLAELRHNQKQKISRRRPSRYAARRLRQKPLAPSTGRPQPTRYWHDRRKLRS